jgi:hypothetical protein
MKMFQLKSIAAPLVGMTLALAGCATGQYDKITEVSSEKSLLRFYGKAQKGIVPQRVAFADPWEYEEYAGFEGKDVRLEVFYIEAVETQTSVQYTYALQRMVDTWRYNAGKTKSWGEEYNVENPMTGIDYQRYVLDGQSCAGFHSQWDTPADDDLLRPGRVIFGYLCARAGNKLSDAVIDDSLRNIGIRGLTEKIRRNDPIQIAMPFGEKSDVPLKSKAKALAIAKGVSSGSHGNSNFPFEFVVHFQESNSSDTTVDN